MGGAGTRAVISGRSVAPPGRAREVARIDEALHRLHEGSGGVVILDGEAGVGKTHLAAWAKDRAADLGFGVLDGRCFALAADTPYAPVVAALRPQLRHGARAREALINGLTSLSLLFDDVPAPAATDPSVARIRLHDAVATLLSRLAVSNPVLLVLDDLHWADSASLELLQFLTGDLPDTPLLLLVTVRVPDDRERPDLRAVLAGWRRERWTTAVQVDRLDQAAVAQMLDERLSSPVPGALLELVWERSAGTPLVVEELVTDLVDRGWLRLVGGAWDLDPRAEPRARAATELAAERIGSLPRPCRDALAVLSLAGEPLTYDVIAAVDGLDDATRVDALATLLAAGLVDQDRMPDGSLQWAPHHPVVTEAVAARLSEIERRAIHRSLLDVLRGAPPTRRARHLLGAGHLDHQGVELLVEAGRLALDQGAPVEATRLLTPAVELIGAGIGREHALGALELLAEAWMRRGEPSLVLEHLRRAIRECDLADDLTSQVRLLSRAETAAWLRGEQEALREMIDRAVDQLKAADRWDELANLAFVTLIGDTRADRADRLAGHVATLSDAARRGFARRTRILADVGRLVVRAAQLEPLGDTLEQLTALLPQCEGDRALRDLRVRCAHTRLDLAMILGDLALIDAAAAAERAATSEAGSPRGWPSWRLPYAAWDAHYARGALDAAAEMRLSGFHTSAARGIARMASMRVRVALARDQHRDASHALAAARADLAVTPREPAADVVVDALEVLISPSDRRAAARFLERSDEVRLHGALGIVPLLARGRAVLLERPADLPRFVDELRWLDGGAGQLSAWAAVFEAEASTVPREAAHLLAHAGAQFERLGRAFETAQCLVRAAAIVADSVADEALDSAASVLRAARAPLVHQADRLLARRGVRSTRAAADPSRLSAREREVAEIVAKGLSNREVAQHLYISVRTVTTHLDHIYSKLGIGSRTELRHVLEPGRSSPDT